VLPSCLVPEPLDQVGRRISHYRRMNCRIGINVGDVMVKDVDLFGHGPKRATTRVVAPRISQMGTVTATGARSQGSG